MDCKKTDKQIQTEVKKWLWNSEKQQYYQPGVFYFNFLKSSFAVHGSAEKAQKLRFLKKCKYIFTSVFPPPNPHTANIKTESNTAFFSSFMP